jgi:hypothetical protein
MMLSVAARTPLVVASARNATTSRTARATTTTRVAASRATARRGDAVTAAAFTPRGANIAGVGMALPEQYLTNEDLGKLVDTNDEWIKSRTGIGKRHVISGDESLTSLAAEASAKEDLDLILLATSSPDDLFGSACTVRLKGGKNKRKNRPTHQKSEKTLSHSCACVCVCVCECVCSCCKPIHAHQASVYSAPPPNTFALLHKITH